MILQLFYLACQCLQLRFHSDVRSFNRSNVILVCSSSVLCQHRGQNWSFISLNFLEKKKKLCLHVHVHACLFLQSTKKREEHHFSVSEEMITFLHFFLLNWAKSLQSNVKASLVYNLQPQLNVCLYCSMNFFFFLLIQPNWRFF